MAALDAVKLLARGLAFMAHPGNGQASLVVLQLHIVLGQSRQFDHDDVAVRRLEDVDRRCPPGGSRREAGHPLLDGEQVLERIPAYESHEWIVPLSLVTPNTRPGARDPDAGLGIRGPEFTFRVGVLNSNVDVLWKSPSPGSESRVPG